VAVLAPVYVPGFELTIDGRRLPAELRTSVTGVHFEEALEGASRIEIQLANQALKLLDAPLLDLDHRVELSLGHRPTGIRRVFAGEITGVEPSFPASGMPMLTVTALDATKRLSASRKNREFPARMTDTVIATIVAAESQLIARTDVAASLAGGLGAFTEKPRVQYKKSDYDFLRGIAAEYGFDMWVDGDFLNLRLNLPHLPAPEIELRWGESLIEFAPRATSVGQIASLGVRIWVEALKTQLSVEVSWDGDRIRTRVTPAVFGDQFSTTEAVLTLPDLPVDSPVDAIKFAIGELRRRLNSRITARGSAIGDPRFRAGQVVSVGGVGRDFSGDDYRLTSVTHTIGAGGYQTNFEARKEMI
jgi:phage protein D